MSNVHVPRFASRVGYWIREYFGENAYPRYLAEWQVDHAGRPQDDVHQPLNERQFFAARMQVRFGGDTQRCC